MPLHKLLLELRKREKRSAESLELVGEEVSRKGDRLTRMRGEEERLDKEYHAAKNKLTDGEARLKEEDKEATDRLAELKEELMDLRGRGGGGDGGDLGKLKAKAEKAESQVYLKSIFTIYL